MPQPGVVTDEPIGQIGIAVDERDRLHVGALHEPGQEATRVRLVSRGAAAEGVRVDGDAGPRRGHRGYDSHALRATSSSQGFR